MPRARRCFRDVARHMCPGVAKMREILSRKDGVRAIRRQRSHRRVAVGPSAKTTGSSPGVRWV
jgi:hypothetical protein